MKFVLSPMIIKKTEALLKALDHDQAHIEQSLTVLDRMRALLVKQNPTGLAELLEQVRTQNQTYHRHDHQRQELRQDLARELSCAAPQVTLSQLEARLPEPWQSSIRAKKQSLQHLVHQLQLQWQITSVLLNDCARLNRKMFQALFQPQPSRTLSYGPAGHQQQTTHAHMMNMHF